MCVFVCVCVCVCVCVDIAVYKVYPIVSGSKAAGP